MGIGEVAVVACGWGFLVILCFADLDVQGLRTFVGEKLHRSPRFWSDEVSYMHR